MKILESQIRLILCHKNKNQIFEMEKSTHYEAFKKNIREHRNLKMNTITKA